MAAVMDMVAVLVYGSGGRIGQRWWYMAAVVGYGNGGGIWQQRR